MKTKSIVLSLIFVMALSLTTFAETSKDSTAIKLPSEPLMINGGPGIVVSASTQVDQLPADAQQFLREYYGDNPVMKCKINYVKDNSSVTLADGTGITFDKDGKVDDIRTANNTSLPTRVLEAVLPAEAYKHLVATDCQGLVSAVKNAHGRGFHVMLLDTVPPYMIFDMGGVFVITAG